MAGLDDTHPDLRAAARAVRLTLLGLWAERVVQAFWPLFTVLMVVLAIFLFGIDGYLPIEGWWLAVLAGVIATGTAIWRGVRQFSAPTLVEARDRVDQRLPGRPLAAINDSMALGQADEASRQMWEAHQRRMAERAAKAERVAPDFRISRRDPYALRHLATLALVAGLLFGGAFRLSQGGPLIEGIAAANSGPTWEGWIDPPAYTGKPGLYLADQQTGALGIPVGSRITLRLYGDSPPDVSQSVADTPIDAAAKSLEFIVTKSGTLSIGDDAWDVIATPDAPPDILADGEAERAAGGEMRLKFKATDDYGVIAAQAVMTLDLSQVDRRYGLVLDPEVTEAIIVDLPMPIAGNRKEIAGLMAEDFSKHPWAGQPVILTLTASDEADQQGTAEGISVILEGKRFFDPLASAVAEQRRDLVWNRLNGPRVAQVLRASSWQPDDLSLRASVYLRLKAAIRELEGGLAAGPLTDELRDNIAEVLWQIALDIEDGKMADALERLRKAQEKLAEAIKNGASDEEIAELTQEMREAMRDYIQQLAENSEPGEQQQAQNSQTITQDQLDQMMKKLQELMEQGRDEEAQALLDQLMQMMENMQVTQGDGQGSEGDQAMKGLSDTLKEQQDLSDDTFRDRQQGQQGEQQPGGQNGQGDEQQPGQGQQQQGENGQNGQQGQNGPGGQTLAERQQALRRMLNDQASRVPGLGGQQGEDLKRSLDNAGRAMDRAEEDLRNQDYAGALNNQADAMEELRQGMRDLGEMLAEQNPGEGRQGDAESKAEGESDRDPLGREMGSNGRRIGTDERLLQGDDVYRRARELLDEIRRRSSDRERPQIELDYLQRLLDQF